MIKLKSFAESEGKQSANDSSPKKIRISLQKEKTINSELQGSEKLGKVNSIENQKLVELQFRRKEGSKQHNRRKSRIQKFGLNKAYMNDLMVYYNNYNKGSFFVKRLKTLVRISYYLTSSILNILSILIFVIDNQSDDSSSENEVITMLDFVLACFFLAELIGTLTFSSKRLKFIFTWDFLIDVLSITPSFITKFSSSDVKLNFLRILRILRVMRVFRLYKYLKLLKPDSNESYEIRFSSSLSFSKVQQQLFSMGVVMMAVIFISAGAVTLIEQYEKGSFNLEKLTFIDATYFIIVTASTIGFGDMFPTNVYSRVLTIVVLLVTLYIVSDQLTKVVNLLRVTDKNDVMYTFSNHIILVGDFNTSSLKTFLKEIYGMSKKGPMMVVIHLNMNELNMEIFQSLPAYKKKIFFLHSKRYDFDTFVKANFHDCEFIFCLNQNMSKDAFVTDKILSFNIKNINLFNNIENEQTQEGKFKKLYTQYLAQEKNFKFPFMPLQISFPSMSLKTSLIVRSIFNKGYLTFITNLFNTNKTNNVSVNHEYVNSYIDGLKMRLIVQRLPKNIPVMHLKNLSYLIYKYSTEGDWKHIHEDENSDDKSQAVLLIGMMMINLPKEKNDKIEIDSIEIGSCIENITFNPESYTASNALGIYIYSSKEKLRSMITHFENEPEIIPQDFHKNSKSSTSFNNIFETYNEKQLNAITNVYYKLNYVNPNSRFFTCEEFANTSIKNHIIILGMSTFVDQIILKVRVHSLSLPIVILTDYLEEEVKIKLFQRFKNLFIVKGDHLELKNLYNVKTKMARFVIILSSKRTNTLNADSNSILAAKMIEQYFNVPYSLEIMDSVNSQFLGSIPQLNNEEEQEVLTDNLYPQFMSGNILYAELLDKLIARSFNNLYEAAAFKAIISQDYHIQTSKLYNKGISNFEVEDNFMKNLIEENAETEIFKKSNLSIFSFDVPENLHGMKYRELMNELFESKKVFIPLGIYVEDYALEKERNAVNVNVWLDKEVDSLSILKNKTKKYYDIYKQNFPTEKLDFVFLDEMESGIFITNPKLDMKMTKGMSVMCLSTMTKIEKSKKEGKKFMKRLQGCEKFFVDNNMINNMQEFQQKMKYTKAILNKFDAKIQEFEESEFKMD